ncbi:recombinase family protein [Gulbenkiania mobilis]|uniref:recombinase family protein n=1 Tax=Gulbenkiania mobilis TaxID=397457 RepID=UPI0006BBBF9E|nr:recombinase family protein [Gulbenkiania mobilis]
MGATLAYVRVSSDSQSTEAQRHAIAERYNIAEAEHWFEDSAVSGAVKALQRPGFAELYKFARKGDTVVVVAIDRLGRDTIDVLETVEALKAKGVAVVSMREGFDLSTPAGKLVMTMLAAVAEMERANIKARQMAGIERAKAVGKRLGRRKSIDDAVVAQWRRDNGASVRDTALRFGVSEASVKRACRAEPPAA